MANFSQGRLYIPSLNYAPYGSPGSPMNFQLGIMPDLGAATAARTTYPISVENKGYTSVQIRGQFKSPKAPLAAGRSPYTVVHPGQTGVVYFTGSPGLNIYLQAWQFPQPRYISFMSSGTPPDRIGELEIIDI